jgi:hypothetical protein
MGESKMDKILELLTKVISSIMEIYRMLVGANNLDGKKTFDIYQHPDGRIYAVKMGFNWVTFFLSPFWLIYRRLWLHVAIVWIIGALTAFIPGIIFGMFYGYFGNEMVRKNLSSRGFRNKQIVQAKNPDEALAKFYESENER